jgi:outer membrane protein TolC
VAVQTAEQTFQQAELALVQAQANRLSDTAALFQSLGGGWWNRPAEGGEEKSVEESHEFSGSAGR